MWLSSADRGYSIAVPPGWMYPGLNQSLSPMGLTHLFFLAPKDKVFGLDISVASQSDTGLADEMFEVARIPTNQMVGKRKKPAMQSAVLSDGITFKFFEHRDKVNNKVNYFMQGILKKEGQAYYVLYTSDKRHPNSEDRKNIYAALSSLTLGLTLGARTVGGKKVSKTDEKTSVINVAKDGSILKVLQPWTLDSWNYTGRAGLGQTLHAFRLGAIRAAVSRLGTLPPEKSPKVVINSLAKKYEKGSLIPLRQVTEKLANGITIYCLIREYREFEGGPHLLMEGMFRRPADQTSLYYFIVVAPQSAFEPKAFEQNSRDALRTLATLHW